MPTDAERQRSQVSSRSSNEHPAENEALNSPTTEPEETEDKKKEVGCTTKVENVLSVFCNAIFIKAFVLTFVAEWGDRSQISTVGLAVSTSPFAVFLGGSAGHFVCTMGAVIFGAVVAKRISLSILNICGAVIFLGFAGYSFYLAYTGKND